MQKKNLQTGMLVRYRNGQFRRVFINNNDPNDDKSGFAGGGASGSRRLQWYDDDLTNKPSPNTLDVMAVYKPVSLVSMRYLDPEYHEIIWARDVPKLISDFTGIPVAFSFLESQAE